MSINAAGFDDAPKAPFRYENISVSDGARLLLGDAYSVGSSGNLIEQRWYYKTLFDFILELLSTQKPLPRIAEPIDDMDIRSDCHIMVAFAPEELRYLVWYFATYTLLIWKFSQSASDDDVDVTDFLGLWAQICRDHSIQQSETLSKSRSSNGHRVVFLEREVELLTKELSVELRKRWSDLIRDENVRGALAELCRSDLYYDQIVVKVLDQLEQEHNSSTPNAFNKPAETLKPVASSFDQSMLVSPMNEEVDKELKANLSKFMKAAGKEWGENDALENWAVHQVRANPVAMATILRWRDFQRETGDKQYDSISSGEE